jgi:hypothetical protein
LQRTLLGVLEVRVEIKSRLSWEAAIEVYSANDLPFLLMRRGSRLALDIASASETIGMEPLEGDPGPGASKPMYA